MTTQLAEDRVRQFPANTGNSTKRPPALSVTDGEPCDICQAPGAMQPYLDVSMSGVMTGQVHRCRRCGFRQVRPRPSRGQLELLYPPEYFDSTTEIGFRDCARQQQRYEQQAYFLAKRLKKISRQGNLLEVGCGLGFLLQGLAKYSPWRVVGIDISQLATHFAREQCGLDVCAGTLEESAFPDSHFDVVVQKDLLEHVSHPRQHLRETARVLKPGGRLYLITPNGECNLRPLETVAARLRGQQKAELPILGGGHLSFFDRRHLLQIFAETGFLCERVRNVSVRRGLRALGYLPRKNQDVRTVPCADGAAGQPSPPPTQSLAEKTVWLRQLCENLDEEVRKSHRPLRSKAPYFYLRQFMKRLDALPGPFTLGLDFEFWLRKR